MSTTVRIEDIPEHITERLARNLLRACERYFEDPQVQKRFEEWKARKAAEESCV